MGPRMPFLRSLIRAKLHFKGPIIRSAQPLATFIEHSGRSSTPESFHSSSRPLGRVSDRVEFFRTIQQVK